jgi:phosphate uptake regulator
MSLLGVTTDLERVGDEAKKIALYARSIFSAGRSLLPRVVEVRPMADLVHVMLREATRAMDELDPRAAADLVRRDLEVNQSFRAVLARLAGFRVEDPRAISASLDRHCARSFLLTSRQWQSTTRSLRSTSARTASTSRSGAWSTARSIRSTRCAKWCASAAA